MTNQWKSKVWTLSNARRYINLLANEISLLNLDLQPDFPSFHFNASNFKTEDSVLICVFHYCINERDA